MTSDRSAREPSRVTDTVRTTLYQAGDLMAYEASAHDEQVLAEGTPDEIIAWCKGHPARVQLALDYESEREEPRSELHTLLSTLAEFMAPAVQTAQRIDAAFAAAPPEE